MTDYIDVLNKIEATRNERTFVAINMASVLMGDAFGDGWVQKHIRLSAAPDPWMLNGNDAWLKAHPVPPPDMRRVIHFSRVVQLGDIFYTLITGKIGGFDILRQRFRKRSDTRALYSEALIASLLVKNGLSVEVIGESGVKGQDFDLLVKVRGVSVSVEITEIQGGMLSAQAMLNKLQHKKSQVPSDKPAILYVILPESWMNNFGIAFLILNQAFVRFMMRSRRFNAVVLVWGGVRPHGEGGYVNGYLQPVYNNFPRWRIPDYSVFCLKKDKWGNSTYSKSFLDNVRTARFKKQIKAD